VRADVSAATSVARADSATLLERSLELLRECATALVIGEDDTAAFAHVFRACASCVRHAAAVAWASAGRCHRAAMD
jgi:hypothetical protein